jgi:hypothetical protein
MRELIVDQSVYDQALADYCKIGIMPLAITGPLTWDIHGVNRG